MPIKSAIEKIVSLSGIKTALIGENTYATDQLHIVHPAYHTPPTPLAFNTLEGMSGFIKEDIDPDRVANEHLFIHVENYNRVALYGNIDASNENKRFCYAVAALKTEPYEFGDRGWVDIERFVIALQSQFVRTTVVDDIIAMLGNIASEHVKTKKDDGFTQHVQLTTGITTRSSVEVKNPIVLAPYRTFREVAQPELNCILRFKQINDSIACTLFEADGGAWKLEAIKNIKNWFSQTLPVDVVVIG
ncbi:MAG: hypothetical protein RBT11_19845 [Desulfobacterales bacterium]|jgi:hypothetical protein|nr:hypothetical protein [Desulfobacterales bacterium]